MKKIVAILLAVTLMSALVIVPAYAHEGEEATPYSYICNTCSRVMTRKTETEKEYYDYPGCTNNAMTHKHYDLKTFAYYVCNSCNPNIHVGRALISTTKNHCIYY